MSNDAGSQSPLLPAARRRGGTIVSVAVALLLLGGGAAVAAGVLTQDPPPPAPSQVVRANGDESPAPAASPAATPAPVPVPSPTPGADSVAAPLPVEIRIPSIGVSSPLITVGLSPDGTLEVPQPGPDYDKAAWYDGSPRPGAVGPAVIEGHVDGVGGPSIFYDLGDLQPGATIEIAREDGSVVTFVVDAVTTYPKDAFPTLEVYGNTATPALRLITCGGDFDSATGHYVDNTVVFAHQA